MVSSINCYCHVQLGNCESFNICAVDVFLVLFGRSESNSSFYRFMFNSAHSAENVSSLTSRVAAVAVVLALYLIFYSYNALNTC